MTDAMQPALMPSRYHYMINLLETLRAFGGASTSGEVYSWFKDQRIARQEDLESIQPSKETRFAKEVRFARQLLFYGGLIADGPGGSWRLTPEGWDTYLDLEGARSLARRSNWKVRPSEAQPSVARERSGKAQTEGPTTGPHPTAWTGTITREVARPASTYAMRFGGSRVWKIGHTSNLTTRLAELNRHVPTEILRRRWELVLEQRWPNSEVAYRMEQRVLNDPKLQRTTGERVRCDEPGLRDAWQKACEAETMPAGESPLRPIDS